MQGSWHLVLFPALRPLMAKRCGAAWPFPALTSTEQPPSGVVKDPGCCQNLEGPCCEAEPYAIAAHIQLPPQANTAAVLVVDPRLAMTVTAALTSQVTWSNMGKSAQFLTTSSLLLP